MNTLKQILLSISIGTCSLAITSSIWLIALSTTILDPAVPKAWLQNAGTHTQLVTNLASNTPTDEYPSVVPPQAIQTTLSNTFPPSYVQTQLDSIIDSTYSWLQGESSEIIINIPIQDKKPVFQAELATALEPTIAQLPPCTSLNASLGQDCRPPDLTPAQYSQRIAETLTADATLFNQPITNQQVAKDPAGESQDTNQLQNLPTYYQWAQNLSKILPAIAGIALSAALILSNSRLRTVGLISRRTLLGSAISLIVGIILLHISRQPDMLPTAPDQVSTLMTPIFQQALSGIGTSLATISAIITAASAITWVTTIIIRRRQQPPAHITPKQSPPTPPSPPKAT